jgi:formylglycine-generating enzyme required for sulfatase activity
MLLKMDKVDSDDIKEAFSAETIKQAEPGKAGKKFKLSRILIPAVSALLVVIILGAVWLFKRQSKIRWAREVALPEIERLIGENDVWRNLVEPYRMAERAEAILGKDTTLAVLIHQCSRHIDVLTNPPGGSVYMKEYMHPDDEWSFLGVTPLDSVRVPIGIFRWKLEKEGYDTVFAAASTWNLGGEDDMISGYNFVRTLDKKDSIPAGMVRVPATETEVGTLGVFFIGRYEVTNREYKMFVDAGGYRNREFWKRPFMKDGRKLTWEEAIGMFVDQTGRPGPATWLGGDYPKGQGGHPVSGISWYEAAAFAEWAGMSLPTSVHWNVARGALTPMIIWPQLGGFGIFAPFTNFGGKGPVPVGSLPGITTYGAYDMAGNVREWCWNETVAGRVIRGGSWEDNTYEFGYERQAPSMDRSARNGFRLALYPDTGSVPETAFGFRTAFFESDYRSQPPVSDAIFKIYREQFSYDKGDLNAIVESRTENPEGWIHERVSFNAAYGKERVLAHLFLPSRSQPPYQTVIYFPGDASAWMPSSEVLESYYEFTMFLSYLLRNGRAVLYPIYKGTFERGGPDYITTLQVPANMQTYAYTELMVQEVKDLRRSIDYLQIRPDIDSQKIAYLGMSWGAFMGSIIPAVEDRFRASVLIAGGLLGLARPEASDVSYVSRVRTPTLMLNGKYDVFFPPGTSSVPMFDLLGTPPENKRHILYETDHIPPRTEYIKETLDWLDKYLGPVK